MADNVFILPLYLMESLHGTDLSAGCHFPSRWESRAQVHFSFHCCYWEVQSLSVSWPFFVTRFFFFLGTCRLFSLAPGFWKSQWCEVVWVLLPMYRARRGPAQSGNCHSGLGCFHGLFSLITLALMSSLFSPSGNSNILLLYIRDRPFTFYLLSPIFHLHLFALLSRSFSQLYLQT